MTLVGTSGFDLYEHKNGIDQYLRSFVPPCDMKDGYESVWHIGDGKALREYTIHFPLYNDVVSLSIGLRKDSIVTGGAAFSDYKPIVYYGSSITQGGCASRPGNAYSNMISARLNVDHINLGFSGAAKAEQNIAEYIARLPMSVFVCDYDHNAPTVEHLEKTHMVLYRTIRDHNPDLPIIFISKPDNCLIDDHVQRRNVVYQTYMKAFQENPLKAGFIDGYSLLGADYRDCCTVDSCHPNDAGFMRMAEIIGNEIQRMLHQ